MLTLCDPCFFVGLLGSAAELLETSSTAILYLCTRGSKFQHLRLLFPKTGMFGTRVFNLLGTWTLGVYV